MRVLFARCRVIYTGRIDAELEIGDRLIIRKDDGAVIVHATSGLKERNWMPAGSGWSEEPGLIVCEYPKRQERLEIYLDDVYSDSEHSAYLDGRLIKLGSEREFSDLIAKRLDLVAAGLELITREAPSVAGPIDLLCRDLDGTLVAIEVKRVKGVAKETVYQIQRYIEALTSMAEWEGVEVRGMLVAPGLMKGVKELLKEKDFEYIRLSFDELKELDSARPPRPSAPPRVVINGLREEVLHLLAARGADNVRLLEPQTRADGSASDLQLLVDADLGFVALGSLSSDLSRLLGLDVDVTTMEFLEGDGFESQAL